MVSTRGKKIKFDMDPSEIEFDDESDAERPAKRAAKRRKTQRSKYGEDDGAFTPGSSPSKKKGKAALIQNQLITRRSGRSGKLRDLMNMPVDIFAEICSYLDPHDLRRLALTGKRLWDILMTKEVRHIWKTALTSVPNLPECPSDLNEPQYVCLMYSAECYTIGCTSRGTKADWFHRVRFCSTCYESKMAGGWTQSKRQSSLSELGIKESTLSRIQEYFNSRPVMRSYSFPLCYYIEALKKAAGNYEALSNEETGEYLASLKDTRDYRVQTGCAMKEWKSDHMNSRARDIEAEKDARFKSIKAKLLEMGWERRDFPMYNQEFRGLVMKDQKFTPKIWQNIKFKLELLLETSRNERLEREKRQRRRNREKATCDFYRQIARETMGHAFKHSSVDSILPSMEEVLALPSIKSLLEEDTETITEGQWNQVSPDIRYIVAEWWRDTLGLLVDSLEGDTGSQPHKARKGDEGTLNSNQGNETEELILASIAALESKLSYATSVFRCSDHKKVYWYPYNIAHGLSRRCFSSRSKVLDRIQPLDSGGQQLVRRLLTDLKLDPETTRSSEVVFEDQAQKTFLCTRCDERVARYMALDELIDHYLGHQKWFDNVTDAVRSSPDSCYPPQAVNTELPKILNDHDWVSRDELLARQDDKQTREAVLKLQSHFLKGELTDPLPDMDESGSQGDSLAAFFRTETKELRTSLLNQKDSVAHPVEVSHAISEI
ncbi:hypothetical protein FS837_012965 [Tulasnella sp. UAMH 9824]|nr:hypothetical protein FS837_012965 [Tulasnella sp. UAMH 9824]